MVTATGTCSAVGMAGFTLGGVDTASQGLMGWVLIIYCLHKWSLPMGFNRKRRRTSRSLGTTRGGNFGVVVSLEYRLHPLTTVLSGMLLYPLGEATVLRRLNDFMATIPDELTILSGFIQMPGRDSSPFSTALLCESAAGEQVSHPYEPLVLC